jgi:starch-binding outer membrane protein, SusD/RagB family
MKKTIYNLLLIVFTGILFSLSSCEEDFLNRFPLDQPSPDVFFVNEQSAKMAVVAAYQPWTRNANMYQRDLVIMFDALTDDSYWRPSRAASISFSQWNINSADGTSQAYWQYAFQSVNAANFALKEIPSLLDKGLTQAQIDPYLGEAHFMRAFSYLFLVTFFGDVPLLDKPLGSFEEFEQPRASASKVYEMILADFTAARDKLPDAWPGAFKGSATKSAAAGYLAKAYLYTKQWAQAETAARNAVSIAEAAGHFLVSDYESIFSVNNEANPELIFYISYIENSEDFGANYLIQRITRATPPEFNHVYGLVGWGYALPMRDLFDAYEQGDPRREYTLHYPGKPYGIYQTTKPFTYSHRTYDNQGKLVTYSKTYNAGDPIDYDYRWSETGLNVKKSTYNVAHLANERWAGLDVPLMRMADLYLILAEALAEQGKDEALLWVNKVRARQSVNMPPKSKTAGTLVDLVRHERRVELAMEGQRLFDLVRWGKVKETFGNGTKVKKHFFSDYLPANDLATRFARPLLDNYPGNVVLFPIPQLEIDRNSKITPADQNPGY